MKWPFIGFQKHLYRLIGCANKTANTAIISPTTLKKPTTEKVPPINRELKIENFSRSAFKLDFLC